MSKQDALITGYAERMKRSEEKKRSVLRFLRHEIWSTAPILQLVIESPHKQAINRLLLKLEKEGSVRRDIVDVSEGKGITVWGITTHGQLFACDDDEEILDSVFEPSRVSLSTIPHTLDVQRARLKAEQGGWTNWITCDRGSAFKNVPSDHRPDALVTRPDGAVVAIEVERTVKTRKRYQQIVASHLKAMAGKHWAKVYYITPEKLTKRFEKLIRSMPYILINGSQVVLEEKHLSRFEFVSLEDWPNIGDKTE